MKDPKNATLAALCVSATILATVLLLLHAGGPSFAESALSGGEYVMLTGPVSDGRSLLYIADIAAQKLNVYEFDPQKNSIDLIDQVPLALAFREQQPAKR